MMVYKSLEIYFILSNLLGPSQYQPSGLQRYHQSPCSVSTTQFTMDSKSVLHSLSQFVNAVEEMEQAILVPQSLQDMSLSSNNGVVLEKSLFEAFTVLRNLKNVVLTGHALDEKSDGNPISDELLSMTKTLGNMTGLAKNLTDEYKKNFNLLF